LVLRSDKFKSVSGGWSAILAAYLNAHLLGAEGGLSKVGLGVTLSGADVRIFATLKHLLSDGDGLRTAMEWGGQGCMKPCFRHCNIFRKNSGRACYSDGRYHEITCVEPTSFKLWSATELHNAIDVLLLGKAQADAKAMPKVRYQEMVKAIGFHPTPHGLLADRNLRTMVPIVQALLYDWVHTFLSDGVVTNAAWSLLKQACDIEVTTQRAFHEFLSLPWCFSKRRGHRGRNLARLFNDYGAHSNETADTIKSSSSEMMTLYSLMRHWAATTLPADERLSEDIAIFELAAECMDTLVAIKRGIVTTRAGGATLQRQLIRHGERHRLRHGSARWKPKNHWAFDCAEQIMESDYLFDSFVVERAHLRVKEVAERQRDTTHFETAVLSGVINSHINSFTDGGVDGIQGRRAKCADLGGATVGDALDWLGMRFNIGDFVSHVGGNFGEVAACAEEHEACFLIVTEYVLTGSPCAHSALCRASGIRRVWGVADVKECACWRVVDAESRVVIKQ